MAAVVGIDARIEISPDGNSWTQLPERNEFSISIKVDVAEHRVFAATLADAWVTKQRTWMSWSGSLQGYYDTADDQIFDKVVAGAVVHLRFYDSFANDSKVWRGQALLTSVEHSTGTDDYSTLSVDFEGVGALTRIVKP